MALAFRAISALVTQQTTSLSITKPSGTASGDILLLNFAADSQTPTITPPSGFSLVLDEHADFGALHRVYYKIAGGSEPASYAVGLSTTEWAYGHIAAYSGVDTGDPFCATPSANYATGTDDVTATGITTDAANALLVACGFSAWGGTNWSATGFTFRETESSDVYLGLGDVAQASAGASGDKTLTATSSGGPKSAIMLALNPSAGSSDTNITAGAGALTAAGLAPTRLVNYARAPGAGALAAEGLAPTFVERGLRYAYPTADTTAGPWAASTGTDLFAMIDEESASDTDYIYANATGTGKFKILPVTDPGASTGHVVNYRIWSPVAGNAKVRLVQGSTTVVEWTHTSLPATATLYSQSLTGEQADAITDYDDLYLEFEAT